MPAKPGNLVKVDYTGSLEDGSVFDSSKHGDHSHPLEFTAGESQVIKGGRNLANFIHEQDFQNTLD